MSDLRFFMAVARHQVSPTEWESALASFFDVMRQDAHDLLNSFGASK